MSFKDAHLNAQRQQIGLWEQNRTGSGGGRYEDDAFNSGNIYDSESEITTATANSNTSRCEHIIGKTLEVLEKEVRSPFGILISVSSLEGQHQAIYWMGL